MKIGKITIDDNWSTDIYHNESKKEVIVDGNIYYILIYYYENEYCIWLPHTVFYDAYNTIYSKAPGTPCFKNKMAATNHVDEFLVKLSKLKVFL